MRTFELWPANCHRLHSLHDGSYKMYGPSSPKSHHQPQLQLHLQFHLKSLADSSTI